MPDLAAKLPSASEIRLAASQLLESGDYTTTVYQPPAMNWLGTVAKWLDWILRPIFNVGSGLKAVSPVAYYTVIVLLVLVLLALIWHIIYSLRLIVSKKRYARYSPQAPSKPIDSTGYAKLAQEMAEKGDYITAIRLLFRSCLLKLDSEHLRPAITNREYIRRYRNTPARQPLECMVSIIDYKWYGTQSCSEQDWQSAAAAAHSITDYLSEKDIDGNTQ